MLDKLKRARAVFKLTGRFFRSRQVPQDCCLYNINGVNRTVYGRQALSMLIDIVINDSYGLKRFKYLDTIVDVGANIGIFALHASTLFPHAKIFACEPSHLSSINLKNNLRQLNVSTQPYAVGATTRKVLLKYEKDLSACSVLSEAGVSFPDSQECEMLSLDDVAAKIGAPIGLLKLDCEGSEYEIMQTSSLERVRYIVGELHTCQKGNPSLGIELLKKRGFEIDRWLPFPDGQAGIIWASNSRNTTAEKSWLKSIN